MAATDLSAVDRDALERALVIACRSESGRSRQINANWNPSHGLPLRVLQLIARKEIR
jgi:hypothetical protein